jgi:hypothetical protein
MFRHQQLRDEADRHVEASAFVEPRTIAGIERMQRIGRVSSNSEGLASKTKPLSRFGALFSSHDPYQVSGPLSASTLDVRATGVGSCAMALI